MKMESLEICEKPDNWHMVEYALDYGNDFILKNGIIICVCVWGGMYAHGLPPLAKKLGYSWYLFSLFNRISLGMLATLQGGPHTQQ